MGRYWLIFIITLALVSIQGCVHAHLKSKKLCSQCSKCESSKCPPSESYPHMTAFDNSLIAGALQSDYVELGDSGVYSVPNIVGGEIEGSNSYFGWKSSSGAASGYHRFSNYMDKCSGESYLAVDKNGRDVGLSSLSSLHDIAASDWKSVNPPPKLNHKEFRFWVSRSTGKCLTVFYENAAVKRSVGVADCKLDGSNSAQLFAFRFHYHNSFCCCGVHNK